MASRLRIRMYRTGFGDCFLVSFGIGASSRHVLIDFGAHIRGEIGTMDRIIKSIEETTESKLSLLVATHAHRDHISGFGQFADRFAAFELGEVWMPWTDDPNDGLAATWKKKQLALYDSLDKHLRHGLGATEANLQYAAALDALSNLLGNGPATAALARGFGTDAKVRYLTGGTSIAKVSDIPGLSAEILGPSRDKAFMSRMNPPADQRFLTAPDLTTGAVRPFPRLEIRVGDADYNAIIKDGQPTVTAAELQSLHNSAELQAGRLALQLDNVRNNTSLVILFHFQGKSLLFPGDAQWGSWQSWIGTDNARRLLSELDFLKVAHHGSDNATPVDLVHALRDAGLAVMVPTQIQPFPTIPRMPLLRELETHCEGHIAVRSDWIKVPNAPNEAAPKKLPKGFKTGELWLDYVMTLPGSRSKPRLRKRRLTAAQT
jgi:beta-lactamase superfamily II metal-dependent hydrolase